MTKFVFLLFSCLLTFSHLFAQTDSVRPVSTPAVQPPPQDTGSHPVSIHTLPRHDSTTHHFSRRDSLRRDSVTRHKAAVAKDSLALVPVAAPHDSPLAVSPPQPALPVVPSGPTDYSFWMKILSDNLLFNLTGKPVVEIFEVRRPESRDSLFYLIVGILFYFALIRIFFEKYFNNLMTLFFRVSLRQQQIREQVLQAPLPSLLLNILFVISGGLYTSYLLHYSRFGAGISFWILYLYCMIGLSGIYLVKFLALKFGGWVFSISRATDTYIFIVFLVNKMVGIFLLPFLILITFSGDDARQVYITISLAMVFVLWMYRVLAAFRPIRNEIKLAPFHFFLYLCAFEIAPLLLIYKVLLAYLEKV